jgi:hypothetical protein
MTFTQEDRITLQRIALALEVIADAAERVIGTEPPRPKPRIRKRRRGHGGPGSGESR